MRPRDAPVKPGEYARDADDAHEGVDTEEEMRGDGHCEECKAKDSLVV
jgi:hypothetical protein